MAIVRISLIKLAALKWLSGIHKLQASEWNCMLRSDTKAIPRCFLFKNKMDISGLGGLDSFRSQQPRQVVLGLLLLIFAKLIVQPPLFLNSFILVPTSLCLQEMEEVELFLHLIWNMFKRKCCWSLSERWARWNTWKYWELYLHKGIQACFYCRNP